MRDKISKNFFKNPKFKKKNRKMTTIYKMRNMEKQSKHTTIT